ncbi:MAG: 2-succinyl-5-enolpyruvyl-6-hydroxy-3-cyclohexene-1-carboxylic-acid synthase [Bacteroidetes bacterium MedPE-SWsnd-G1]|nr:MAG: 2-succinyl-5-enolpyruvyl-6-hydroxy-3-cyclohexene-1-carboxylic-acid synthase [Bacteroidetes bacterium MedPE-SWsnd-G1]
MPQYPKNDLAQLVIASCVAHDIAHVVISPGSRNAPLTIGFANHNEVKAFSIVDERAAAFFALGLAQQLRKPVAVVCTSGSALLNYYPAIAEAFYSDIPLVVISADRPKHLIDIGDGQTLRQENVFSNHLLNNANLRENSTKNKDMLIKVLRQCIVDNGPVHINVPFDEPLYELTNTIKVLDKAKLRIEETPLDVDKLQKYADIWNASAKKMVLVGTSFPDELLQIQLNKIIEDESVIVLTETTSNLVHSQYINGIDRAIFPLTSENLEGLKPEILLTFGGMVVSKKVKQFLRNHKPKHHWHVDSKKAFDTYFSLTKHFGISPQLFFSQFFFLTQKVESNYQRLWLNIKRERIEKHNEFIDECEFSDLKVFETVLKSIPRNAQLQLSNSSIIRYTQLFDLDPSLKVFCNRGTSGIDGSTSTAIGASLIHKESTVFVTGDISFIYDSNALWNNDIRSDFRIIIINNDGGGIFKFIPGPKETNALSYFETPHGLNASHLSKMFGFEYEKVEDVIGLEKSLEQFYKGSEHPKILEVCTPSQLNDLILKSYFKSLK